MTLVDKLREKNHRIVWIKLLSTESYEPVSLFSFYNLSK